MKTPVVNTVKERPLVSIALPTCNGEKFLNQQIDSLLAQTYTNIEIIAVDDASIDQTKALLEEYALKDNRFRFFINENNMGYNKNFEKAIRLCSAQFIAISDQDDIWEPVKIESMMKGWSTGSLFIYSLSGTFNDNDFTTKQPAQKVHYANIDNTHSLVFNSPVHGHASMLKKELVPYCLPFPTDIFYDWWISMHAASIGVIGVVPRTLTWHRVHEKNSSRTLTSIIDKEERDSQLRQQIIYFLETFCKKDIGKEKEKKSLLEYAALLKDMDGKKFSPGMFRYVIKNRRLIFHYKKKPFVFFSHIKHAFRMARKGLL